MASTQSDPTLDPVEPLGKDSVPNPTPAPLAIPIEHGGRPGPEPTRYGDWEKNGRCIDF